MKNKRLKKTVPNFLKKNLIALRKNDKFLAELIENHKVDKLKYVSGIFGDTKFVNLQIPEKKMFFYDPNSVRLSVLKDIENSDLKNPKLTIFLGLGLGYHFFETIQMHGGKIKNIIVFENDLSVLKLAFTFSDFSTYLERKSFKIFYAKTTDNLYLSIYNYLQDEFQIKLFAKSIGIVSCGGSLALNKNFYFDSFKLFNRVMQQVISEHGNSPEDGLLGLENMFENVDYSIKFPGIKALKQRFKNKTAIVVSTGPSLDKNVDLLHEIKGRALIISCDASFKVLLKRGIIPDIVVSIERGLETLDFYKGTEIYKEKLRDTWFVTLPILKREVHDFCTKELELKSFVVYRNYLHFKWWKVDRGTLGFGKSVANLAFSVASYIGVSQIVLIGQDLAFGEGGKHHSSDADDASKGWDELLGDDNVTSSGSANYLFDKMWVKGNYVDKIQTIYGWYQFKRFFEYDVSVFNGKVINATEGGAYIEGTVVQTLRETIDKNIPAEKNDFSKEIEKYLSMEKFDVRGDFEILKNVFFETKSALKKYVEVSNNALKLINDFKLLFQEEIIKQKKSVLELQIPVLQKIWNQIVELKYSLINDKYFNDYVMHIVQAYIVNKEILINQLDGKYNNKQEVLISKIMITEEWFKDMIKFVEILNAYLNKVIDKMPEYEKLLFNSEEL